MSGLLLALGVFLALHSIPALPPVRAGAIAVLGRRSYLALYSLVSLVVLAWVFHAALNTDYIELWAPAAWQAHVTVVAAPLGLFFVTAGLLSPNPASVTFRHGERPGAIVAITRHPVIWGFILWSSGHVIPNGDLRSLILFGGLGLFSMVGLAVLDRRARRRLGGEWHAVAQTTSLLPFAAILSRRASPVIDRPLVIALVLAALITAWLLSGGHAALFGADPLLLLAS